MLTELPKIYPITDAGISDLSHAQQVRSLANAGARLIQFREKDASGHDFYRSALEALDAAHKFGAKLIINDRVDIALTINADGVHLGQDDLPPVHARQILGDQAIIGYSTHNFEQAMEAASLPVDYIALGPIFPTTTKANPDEVVGLELLNRVRQQLPNIRLVAIGGITAANIAGVFAAGADSAAVISSVLADPSQIAARFHELSSLASAGNIV
ncbi:MAG: thiamine phosphate synthase [Acidobacteriota bacterium]